MRRRNILINSDDWGSRGLEAVSLRSAVRPFGLASWRAGCWRTETLLTHQNTIQLAPARGIAFWCVSPAFRDFSGW